METKVKSRLNGWIVTYTGKKFWPLDPRPEDIDIIDIAHALSNICRFTGHVREFYSVAQHSVHVALLSNDYQLYGLLHDASEAYLCDVSSPVKRDQSFSKYRAHEKRLQDMIYFEFGLTVSPSGYGTVRRADHFMAVLEGQSLMSHHSEAFWVQEAKDLRIPVNLTGWSPKRAEENFLDCFASIGGKK